MSDANRSGNHEMVEANLDLKIQHYKILINEKLGQIKNLEITVEKYKTVEIKRTELMIDISKRELIQMRKDLHMMEIKLNAVNVNSK